jgi:hypothetical protein
MSGTLKQEDSKWLTAHGFTIPYEAGFPFVNEFRTPLQSMRQSALVEGILTWLPSDGEGLLLVTDCGMWGSTERGSLFHRVRSTLGESRLVGEAPGQVINLADRGALECMLDVCLYLLWDVLLADSRHRFLIKSSHDEFVTFACNAELESEAAHTIKLFSE